MMFNKKLSDEVIGLSAIDVLNSAGSVWWKTPEERAAMTLACRDTDYLPKVSDAGKTKVVHGTEVQVMHNGLLVKKNGYQGEWQAKTIEDLRGNHEPQEEKVFYEVVQRVKPGGAMIELGSWWSYYSMWYLKATKNSKAICCEPDPENLVLGRANAALNKFEIDKDIIFYPVAAGAKDGKLEGFETEADAYVDVEVRSVDSIVKEQNVERLDILHIDIQGFELDALHGALQTIKQGKLRFLFVSTHHYAISGDPMMHYKCLDFITKHGGHIVAKHTVLESCSGDGLIVASFDPRDAGFTVQTSLQHTDDSLFRPSEMDIAVLWEAHNRLLGLNEQNALMMKDRMAELESEIQLKAKYILHLEGQINEITPLRRHFKRQVKAKLKGVNGRIVRTLKSHKRYKPTAIADHDDLLQAAKQTDKANFEEYNKAAKDPAVLRAYLRARGMAARVANKILRGKL